MAGYYDIVLGLIPLALLGITAALTVVGASVTTAVPVGAVVAIGLIGHAMFVNAPTDSPAAGRPARSNQSPLNAD
ncbi:MULTISPECIES: hypothetical protein [Saliphagus]|uniref:Uncharacterized protein n=1 Tax=Saliphagus infecundisoli TaxID=1849069 RepID=A0ABD5QGE4_9EURY|nr:MULTISPECIES: hypothetical protein [Saliphagus]